MQEKLAFEIKERKQYAAATSAAGKLQDALDAASGPSPTGLIIAGPDGIPGRVSCVEPDGRLMHRPFDGAFPAHYPVETVMRHCREVFLRLPECPDGSARDRTYVVLLMAADELRTFSHDEGRHLNEALSKAGMDGQTKQTVILKLHPNPSVGQLLPDSAAAISATIIAEGNSQTMALTGRSRRGSSMNFALTSHPQAVDAPGLAQPRTTDPRAAHTQQAQQKQIGRRRHQPDLSVQRTRDRLPHGDGTLFIVT